KERILIVDDESFIREVLTRVVTGAGFESDTAQNAEEAMQQLAVTNYEMVLSDISMPGLDGFQLLQHVSINHPEVAVIMITGVDNVQSAVRALSSGAYDYVTKPFDVLKLKDKIDTALTRRQLLLENRQHQLHLERRVDERTAELRAALGRITDTCSHT